MDNVRQSPFETMQPGDHMNLAQFGEQASAGSGVFGSPGLADEQAAANAAVPRSVTPSISGNGMSSEQYQQTLGGQMPTDNGMAAKQYSISKYSMRNGG
jgi:hypothetical protein